MVSKKDWNRMTELVLTDSEATGVARSIKCKKKAMSRYVAGLKLMGEEPLSYCDTFEAFRDRALRLGATEEEIRELYDQVEAPAEYLEKISRYRGKKISNRFVGFISKFVLDSGCDIRFLPHNGDAITIEGRWAMQQNGLKWTIGYKTQIVKGDSVVDFLFDAVTCEGGGATQYVTYSNYNRIGKRAILDIVKGIINKL
jgi:hypothetical protein